MYELLLHPQGTCHPPSTCRVKDTAEWDPKDEMCTEQEHIHARGPESRFTRCLVCQVLLKEVEPVGRLPSAQNSLGSC